MVGWLVMVVLSVVVEVVAVEMVVELWRRLGLGLPAPTMEPPGQIARGR